LGTNTHLAVNPIVVKDLPYDPVKDLKPITGLARGMMIFVGNPQSKITNVADLVKASKAQPQGLSVGTYTAGFHLSAAWFASEASIPFVNVSYKGAPEVFLGLMAGQLEWGVSDLIAAMPQVKAGKLRALAVSGEARHPDYPDIPTLKELGYPNYVNYTWTTLYVRSETPEPVTQKLVETLQKIMATQGTKDYIRSIGSDPLNLQANEMRQFQRSETERFKRIADGAGIRPQ
jgi:tripartite-type tricarboxylate transporter receptor subunit TctC